MSNIDVLPSTSGSAVPVATKTMTVDGVPDIDVQYTIPGFESAGALVPVDATHGLPVNLLNSSIAVTAGALPLPAGAATLAAQTSIYNAVVMTNGYLATLSTNLVACNTGAVTVVTSALPAGAATAANQATANTALAACETSLASINTALTAVDPADSIWVGDTNYVVQSHSALITASGSAAGTLVPGVSGKVFRVVDYCIGPVSAPVTVSLHTATDGDLFAPKYLASYRGISRYALSMGYGQSSNPGEDLQLNANVPYGTSNIPVDIHYILM